MTAVRSALAPGLAMAAIGSIAFTGKAIIVKLAYRYGVDPVTLIMYRMLFALPIFAAMGWWAGRGLPRLAGRDWVNVIFLGIVGYYLSSLLDFTGLQYITASLERLILYLSPTLVVLLGWALHRKPLGRYQLAGMALSYLGVLLVFGQEVGAQGSDAALGSLLVLGSAITYAVYLVSSGQMVQRLGSLRLVGLTTSVACLCCIAQFLITQPVEVALQVAPQVVWLSVLNAIACTVVPVLLVMMAIERIGAGLTAQTGMIGPLATIFLGAIVLDEPFTVWVAAGTVLVLAGIYLFSRKTAQPQPQSHK